MAADITLSGWNLTLVTAAGVTGTGGIANGSATAATLTIDQAGTSTYSGVIGGATATAQNLALVTQGSGTLSLAGDSNYSGTTTVDAGTLLVDGTSGTGAMTVNSGGTIGGTGTVGGDLTVDSGGTLNPGDNAVGTLTVTGQLTFNAGSTFFVNIGPGTAADKVDVGSLALPGGANLLGTATAPLTGPYQLFNEGSLGGALSDSFHDINGTDLTFPDGGLIFVGGQPFDYSYVSPSLGLTLTPVGTQVALDGSGNLDVTDTVGHNDTLTVSRTGADLVVTDPNNILVAESGVTQVDAHTVELSFASITGQIQIDTGAGDDAVTLDLANGILPPGGIAYDGGAGGNDLLSVVGSGTESADYTPSSTTTGSGTIAVGGQTITFSNLEPVDMSNLLAATVTLPGADDVVTVADGFDAATGKIPALVVTGTSGGVNIESAHLSNNTTVTIDTTAIDGNDAVTIASADNAHGNHNLVINTGAGTDAVTVAGAATFAGDVSIQSQSIAVNALLTAGAANTVTLNAGDGAITTTAAGTVVVAGSLSLSATTGITLTTAVGTLAAANATSGGVAVTNAADFAVGTVGSVSGVMAIGQAVTLAATVGTLTVTQPIAATGTAGSVALTAGQSVDVVANVTVTGGENGVQITGSGLVAEDSIGVAVEPGATVTTTDNGAVTITGTGGAGSGELDDGVYIGGTVTSGGTGVVIITGTGGAGTGYLDYGVGIDGTVTSGGTGAVTITGTGSTGGERSITGS
ncbi:putative autotransporter protein [Fimbriiglobus ruber]|uniref:Putative autotransporter protein n=1 Tax=Fimbriiglobus ruber TaxID=1908690 RepID=A0A225DW23_9BACT|nr:putative autotransporter protein [Fimbriiglobus ruber]